ncbi:MAG: hypothetical protein MJY98_08380 [Fibrobacter sp.]|nr:hypothetical protein [Fibrobacter sp.]
MKKNEWNPDSGIFEDSRKGIRFATKRFGNQVWMVESLCLKGNTVFTAKQAMKALPKGWRFPTRSDILELENFIGATYGCSPVMAILSPKSSVFPWFYDCGKPAKLGVSGFDWDSFQGSSSSFWYMQDNGILDSVKFKWFGLQMSDPSEEKTESYGSYKVRAVWDGNPSNSATELLQKPQEKFGSFTDARDGKMYRTVVFGEQEWFADDLHFDGKSDYNWPDFLKAIPEGWRVPTRRDIGKLLCYVADNYFVCDNEVFKKNSAQVDVTGLASDSGKYWEIFRWTEKGLEFTSISYRDFEKTRNPLRLMRDSSYSDDDNKSYRRDLFAFCEEVARGVGRLPEEAGEETYRLRLEQLRKVAEAHRNFGSFTDPRDGEVYKTVSINGVTWMAENLRYKCDGAFAYHDDEENVKRFGRLYTEEACCQGDADYDAVSARAFRGVAPEGWHIASAAEWSELMDYAMELGLHREELSEGAFVSADGWDYENERIVLSGAKFDRPIYSVEIQVAERLDLLGLGIKPAGYRNYENKYGGMGKSTAYRTFVHLENRIQSFGMRPSLWGMERCNSMDAYPVRCVKNETYEEIFARNARGVKTDFGEFIDERDGEKYRTIKIGNQIWMAENLRHKTGLCQDYGYSCGYTWNDAVSGVAPKGWHIPTKGEFDILVESIGDKSAEACGLINIRGVEWRYWTSEKYASKEASLNEFAYYGVFGRARGLSTMGIDSFLSVRCIKDDE